MGYDPNQSYPSPVDARQFSMQNSFANDCLVGASNIQPWELHTLNNFLQTEAEWQRYHGKPPHLLPPLNPDAANLTWVNDWVPPLCSNGQWAYAPDWNTNKPPIDPSVKNVFSAPTNPVNLDPSGKPDDFGRVSECGCINGNLLWLAGYGGEVYDDTTYYPDPSTGNTPLPINGLPPSATITIKPPTITVPGIPGYIPPVAPVVPVSVPPNTTQQPDLAPDQPVVNVSSSPNVNPVAPVSTVATPTAGIDLSSLSSLTSSPTGLIAIAVVAFLLLKK